MCSKLMTLLVFWVLCLPTVAMAGPGGKIAKALAQTFWGKVAMVILVIVALPIATYVLLKEYRAKKRALNDLAVVARINPDFDWIKLRRRIQDCFYRVHTAWEKCDVSEASEWMTDWYWRNQQLVYLDRWEREGLVNICQVDRIKSIKPILFALRGDNGQPCEGSEIAVLVEAKMRDYLERKSDGKLIEGCREQKDVDRIWSFTYQAGRWVVSNIDEGSKTLQYIEMMRGVPKIEEAMNLYGRVSTVKK